MVVWRHVRQLSPLITCLCMSKLLGLLKSADSGKGLITAFSSSHFTSLQQPTSLSERVERGEENRWKERIRQRRRGGRAAEERVKRRSSAWVCGGRLYVQYVYSSGQCIYFKLLILCRCLFWSSCESQVFTSECVCVLNVGVCMHQCQTRTKSMTLL